MSDQNFFDTVRPLFGGRLTSGQVEGMQHIVEYGRQHGTSRVHLAYILATVFHETAQWMWPIREGARRFGPDYTDVQARRAVTAIYNKGIIRTNYSLPDENGNSFYGRGLVQITWKENYAKFNDMLNARLDLEPDLTLEWEYALPILFTGMKRGMFTGRSLDMVTEEHKNFVQARAIVNGDARKNGRMIADQAEVFYTALANYRPLLTSGRERLAESRTIKGGAAAGTATVGVAGVEVAQEVLTELEYGLGGLAVHLDSLRWVFIAIALAGVALTVYARWDDFRKGKR